MEQIKKERKKINKKQTGRKVKKEKMKRERERERE